MKPFRLLSLFLCLCPPAVYAQTAEVAGAVQDPSGAVIPKASVEFRNQETGIRRQTTTNNDGYYHVVGVDPGKYDATVQAKGFKTLTRENVTFQVGDKSQIDFKMQVGEASQSVTVDGSGLQINTTNGSVSTVISRQFVENLPLNGRSFQDLILMTPGVVTQSPQSNQAAGSSGDFSINGQRTESNYYTVDGVSANANPGHGGSPGNAAGGTLPSATALGTTQSIVSVDALQEFRIESSTYAAEYGRTPGGQISFITRSGTSKVHGSAFDFLRNNYFDANNWFTNYLKTTQPALRQNDFGGTLGGPIRIPRVYDGKDKSFFFLSYEGLRLKQPQAPTLQYVPSTSFRQNSSIPSVLQPLLNAFPLPTPGGTDYGNGLADFIQAESLPSHIDSTSIRFDHSVGSAVRAFFRFSNAPSSSASRALSVYQVSHLQMRTYTGGLTAQIGRSLTDDFRLGLTQGNQIQSNTLDSFGGATPTALAQALGADSSPNATALFYISIAGTGTSFIEPQATSNVQSQWNITDSLSWSLGKHQLKFGFDYLDIKSTATPTTPFVEYIYTSTAQILSNKAATAVGSVSLPGTPVYHEFSAFVQDEWRLSPRFTLSPGLRWEHNPPPGDANGNIPYTLQGSIYVPSTLTLAPKGTPLWQTTWYDFAPRLGVAWTANSTPGHQTIIRAGGGAFFDTNSEVASLGYQAGVGFYASKSMGSAPAPFPGGVNATAIPITVAPPYTSAGVNAIYPHLQLPYSLQWSAALEQALGNSQTFTISYVAADGRRLLKRSQSSIKALNPNFGTIYQYGNGLTSNYQALEAKFQRSVAHGIQALASYTWSHSIDFESNYVTITPIKGNSDFDVRNSFTGGVTWQLPDIHRSRAANMAVDGLALDAHYIARGGFPVNILGATSTDPLTGSQYTSGTNIVPNQPFYLSVHGIPGNRKINSAAFTPATVNTNGNTPRNFLRGFGAQQLNIAVRRDFPIRENLSLQFRAETFNLFNHPNFGVIDSILTDKTFGQATQTLSQSLTTVSPLYQMGGPRSMQFALRLQF